MQAPFLLVSDFDDTLKISHTTNRMRTVFRGLFTKQSYAGMAELYQEWLNDSPFVLLSSSPVWIHRKIERFLERHDFPKREIVLRDWIRQKDVRRFKSDALARLEARDEKGYIFIGDDAEYDPEVFAKFRDRNPERTLAIYIRKMRGRPLPPGVVSFHSALEIALAELQAGRLKIPQVARIGKAVIESRQAENIIPHFASLPIDIALLEKFPSLEQIIDRMNIRYAAIRSTRKLKPKK